MLTESWQLSKFDVAERQLLQAIRLFFQRGDEVSIHTLAEAAAQVLYDTRMDNGGGISILRDYDRIRPERKKEWLGHVFKSKNFFKHADRDRGSVHEFKASFNHFSLLDAVNLYGHAKRAWTPETMTFFAWFTLSYPGVVKDDEPMISALIQSNLSGPYPIDVSDFELFSTCIEQLRTGRIRWENLTLDLGLPAQA